MKAMVLQKKSSSNGSYYDSLQSLLGNEKKLETFKSQGKEQDLFVSDRAYEIINSKVKFQDVVQTPSLKSDFTNLINEFLHKETLKSYGINADNKIIFFGPSGCGKTMSAMALANKLNKKLFLVNLATIVDSSLGKTSSNVAEIVAEAASQNGIIFFDEFDALAKMRSDENDHGEMKRVASSIIQILDFLNEDSVFIAATNHIDLIDKAILRRFGKKISFDMPTPKLLEIYIEKIIKPTNLKMSKSVMKAIATELQGLSFAEARDAFLAKLKRYLIAKSKNNKASLKSISSDILKV